jgi:hypothetical protein
MVEVDATLLIVGGTALVTITVAAIACRPSGRHQKTTTSIVPTTTNNTTVPKKKKAVKSTTKAPVKAEEDESEVKEKPELLPFKQVPALVKTEESKPKPVAKAVKIVEPIQETHVVEKAPKVEPVVSVAVDQKEDESKASKKSKETPEQKAARVERQKIAKAVKAADDEARAVADAIDLAAPSSSTTSRSVVSEPVSAEGWEVVGKVKPTKKSKAEEEKPADKKLEDAVDQARQIVVVESKKVGAVIGQKGVNLKAITDLTGAEVTLPKERDTTGSVEAVITGPPEGVKKGMYDLCLFVLCS